LSNEDGKIELNRSRSPLLGCECQGCRLLRDEALLKEDCSDCDNCDCDEELEVQEWPEIEVNEYIIMMGTKSRLRVRRSCTFRRVVHTASGMAFT